jgi:hypothetical protein
LFYLNEKDYNGSNGMYKQQAPLRPPPLNPPTSIRGSIISPRFDNIATRSSTIPWSPAPFTGAPYEKPSVDPFLTSQQFVRPSEIWTNNNVHPKSTDSWLNNNVHTKSSDPWLNNNAHIKPPDQLVNNNVHPKSPDAWLHNNTQSKTSELWSPSNGFRRAQESIVNSNNSSNAPMIKKFETRRRKYIE